MFVASRMLFVSVGTSLLKTALTVQAWALLISIFVELLITIVIRVQDRRIFEPFLAY